MIASVPYFKDRARCGGKSGSFALVTIAKSIFTNFWVCNDFAEDDLTKGSFHSKFLFQNYKN